MTLEDQYRRLSRLYPAEWRDQHEEELISTLLDAAEPGRTSISLAEAADLVRGAAILRYRARVVRPMRSAFAGSAEATLRAGRVGLVLVSVLSVVWLVRLGAQDISFEFLLTSVIVAILPGSGVVYTVASSVGGGWRRGLFAAIGCTFGIVPHILAALLGLSGVMQAGAVAFETVRWAGVAYLVFTGASMILGGGALQTEEDRDPTGAPMGTVVRRGVLVNLLNPKLTVFFLAFLPQFLDTPPGLLDPRLIGLSAVFMLITLVVFVGYAWASSAARERVLGAPSVMRWVQRSLGSLLVGVAARLAITDR